MSNFDQYPLDSLTEVMALLRSEKGCPWDKEQDHKSLKKHLIEETYEVLEAINTGDMDNLKEELGDLLLQVVFHCQIASENEYFNINDVIMEIKEKLIRRHPHIFADQEVSTSQQVIRNWEKIKEEEKRKKAVNSKTLLEDVPKAFPALLRAEKIQKKAAKVGFDWDDYHGALDKVQEELEEFKAEIPEEGASDSSQSGVRRKEELGDLLFATVNLARFFSINSEEALLNTIDKFIVRFNFIEEEVTKKGLKLEEVSLSELDNLWNQAKKKSKAK